MSATMPMLDKKTKKQKHNMHYPSSDPDWVRKIHHSLSVEMLYDCPCCMIINNAVLKTQTEQADPRAEPT